MAYSLARTALFALDAEKAHELTLRLFKRLPRLSTAPFARQAVADPFEWRGLRFANRVGLAAGLDKNAECLPAWARLGFGFVEVGTTTPRPQPGNPRPRMFRLPEQQALINRLGFNNLGVDALVANVRAADYSGVLGINIGKNADTPVERAAEDYAYCLEKVHALASYVTVNISSPNTRDLRSLQGDAALTALLGRLAPLRERLADREGRRVPVLVKIAPDLPLEVLPGLARIVQDSGIEGLIATNTTITRPGLEATRWASEAGGLSGAPLRPLAEAVLSRLRAAVGPDFLLVGVGGIDSADAARQRIACGADLLQVYTGFIYRGPEMIAECARAVAASHQSR